ATMTEADNWTVTYREYKLNTERLVDEIDRLKRQTDAATSAVNEAASQTGEMLNIVRRLSLETGRAQAGWRNREAVGEEGALQAASSSTIGTQTAMSDLINEVVAATRPARSAVSEVQLLTRRSWWVITVGVLSAIGLAAITSALTFYFMKASITDQEEEHLKEKGAIFSEILRKANESERKTLKSILLRAPTKSEN
ncbi:hypothetical protein K5D56_26775, partial [Pseudomonas cichorii]|nr:hypothetical protein [Pseudomonas cichorii]